MYKLFRTIQVEHDVPVEGNVTGEIPAWVKGSLYRNGPGMYNIGEDRFNHWFDGMALFQKFDIANKKVTYQSRYLQSDTYKKNMAAQRIVASEFGTLGFPDPCQSIFKRLITRFLPEETTDNCLINFFPLRDELYAASELRYIHRVDPDTLQSLEKVDLSKSLPVFSMIAHPHWDPDGTVHNIGMSLKGTPKICFIRIPPKEETNDEFPAGEIVSSINSDYKFSINYFHSFGMTENYYVYVQQPMFYNFLTIMANRVRGKELCCGLKYYSNIKTRFRIIEKRTGEEVNKDICYEANPFLVFHHINAYEDNDHIVIDLIADKPASRFLQVLYMANITSEESSFGIKDFEDPEPRRYVLPLDVSSSTPTDKNLVSLKHTTATAVRQGSGEILCIHEVLAETGIEFPQINYEQFNGKKYNYVYGVGFHQYGPIYNTLVKIDLKTKTFVEWREEQCYPSEPTFIPNPDGTDEDDGVLLAAVNRIDFDEGNNAFFLVLDAKTMKEIARATFNIPRFPKDFHGLFRAS